MTGVAGEILRFLTSTSRKKASQVGYTDRELADAIGRPLASVRRTRLQLEMSSRIDSTFPARPIRIKLRRKTSPNEIPF